MNMQPITYSTVLNVLALVISGFLAWAFKEPLVFIVCIILQTHIPTRHETEEVEEDDDKGNYEGGGIGFTGKVS